MIKIIAEKVLELSAHYKIIFHNAHSIYDSQLYLILNILADKQLDKLENRILPEYFSDKYNIIHGQEGDNYYIAVYDPFFDNYWESICEKKYGQRVFVYDNETPMLRLSKENFESIIAFWKSLEGFSPIYYVITQNNTSWIHIEGKYHLSKKEQLMVQEFQEKK